MKAWQIGVASCGCIGILLLVILLPISFSTLEHDQYGIRYDTLSNELDHDQIYTEGRHMIGVSSTFFRYSRILKTLDFTGEQGILCLSNEGLDMHLDLSAQYVIIKENLFNIVDDWGQEEAYVPYIESLTRDTVKDVCANFSGEDFFFKRAEIELSMDNALKQEYKEANAYSAFELIQLRNVKHPGDYEQANRDKQSVEQEKDKIIRQRDELITRAGTRLKAAQIQANETLVTARATATSNIREAEELAPAIVKKGTDRGEAFFNIMTQIGDNNVTNFIRTYVKYHLMTKLNQPIVSINE